MVSAIGKYAISTIGIINNAEKLMQGILSRGGYFDGMTGSKVNSNELVAALINTKGSYAEAYATRRT